MRENLVVLRVERIYHRRGRLTTSKRVLVVLSPKARAVGARRLRPWLARMQAATASASASDLPAVVRYLTALLEDGHEPSDGAP